MDVQIEYLVVAYDDERQKVRLSLRQADILDALAKDEALQKQGGCVPDLQKVARYARNLGMKLGVLKDPGMEDRCRPSTPNLAGSCLKLHRVNHGASASTISWTSNRT